MAFYAEFFAVILAVELAYNKGLLKLRLEMDSAVTLCSFFNKNFDPLVIKEKVGNCALA